jgi:dTDP-4-amino-4,6-dideoxygalactose transaminase
MIPFSPPRIDQLTIDAVTEVLRSGWITTGPKTKEFEKKIAAYVGVESVLCLNSATAGLELMLRWFGVTDGDEVILPAYTYSATANVIIHCGAKPVFVDIGDDFNIDPSAVEKAITIRTKVIMPVDFGGLPCNYEQLNNLVSRPENRIKFIPATNEQESLGRILILSDAAHSLGATYRGKKTGALTDVSVFSFHAVKNLTTAEGGAVCLNLPMPFDNQILYQKLCVKSLHGQNKDALAKTKAGNWRYDIVEAGYKANMTDIQAAIGLVELNRYENDTLLKRREIVAYYQHALAVFGWAHLPVIQDTSRESSAHLYPLRIKNITEQERDKIIQRISEKGVTVNVHFIPVPMMSFYQKLGYRIEDYPITYQNYACEISLPVFFDLTIAEMGIIVNAIATSVEEVCGLESKTFQI